jgi:hypothetical protein
VALGVALLAGAMTACGGGSSGPTISASVPETVPTTTSSTVPATSSTRASTTVARPPTRPTVPPTTRATVAPAPATTAGAAPAGRTAALGETFSVGLGETVAVTGEGLTVTFTSVVSDNRCPPGVQCIVAGSATISVTAAKAGTAAAGVTLGTDTPTSATYGKYTVELVRLGRGSAPAANLRVT